MNRMLVTLITIVSSFVAGSVFQKIKSRNKNKTLCAIAMQLEDVDKSHLGAFANYDDFCIAERHQERLVKLGLVMKVTETRFGITKRGVEVGYAIGLYSAVNHPPFKFTNQL
jgi:hypothetical protein